MILDFGFVHTVDVQTLTGAGAYGDIYADPVTDVPCLIEDTIRLVNDSQGNEVTSNTTLFAGLEQTTLFTPGSKVVLPSRTARVITTGVHDSGALQLGLDHVEIHLT